MVRGVVAITTLRTRALVTKLGEPGQLTPLHIAVMTQREFDELPEYSATLPTGTCIGKRWKRRARSGTWTMGEYCDEPDQDKYPGLIQIRWRRIEVVG